MSEAAQLARAAREHLAAALKALQSNTNVPSELLDVAEPIAEAMSVLHRVERTNGESLEGRDLALANVRRALEMTQKVETHHPATDVVMEAVAGSLSKVHALTRYVPPAAPAPAPQPVQAAPPRPTPQPIAAPPAVQQVPIAAAPQPVMTQSVAQPIPAGPSRPVAPAPGTGNLGPMGTLIQLDNQPNPFAAAPQPSAPKPQMSPGGTLPIQAESYAPHTHPQQSAPQPQPAPVAYAQPPQQQAYQQVPQQQAYPQPPQPAPVAYAQPPAPAPQPQRPAPQAQPSPPRDAQTTVPATPTAGRIDVELGIHSTSNFYKGLGGNDVIEAGGIFVATYKVPKIGASVNLRVLLPGDYEFNAIAVVQWTRAAGDVSDPGFGARFTQITPEGRQLVYRYARNREPMFYDDL